MGSSKLRVVSTVWLLALMLTCGGSFTSADAAQREKTTTSNSSNSKSSSNSKVVTTTTQKTTTIKSPVSKSNVTVVNYPKVKSVNKVSPKTSVSIKFNGLEFFVSDNKYYKLVNSKYIWVMPPVGLKVSVLPTVRLSFNFNNRVYYSSGGAIYQEVAGNQYEVVAPEIGMIVPELPEVNVSQVSIDNMIYFEYDNTLYKQIPTQSGLMYEVVGFLSI